MNTKASEAAYPVPSEIADFLAVDEFGAIRWKSDRGAAKRASLAGSLVGRGYRQIKFRGKKYGYHRVAYFLTHGTTPAIVDHRDGNPANNAPNNLRASNDVNNMRNRKLQSNNTFGYPGIYWTKSNKAWRVMIFDHGKQILVGLFKEKAAALKARIDAEAKYYGEHAGNRRMSEKARALIAELEKSQP